MSVKTLIVLDDNLSLSILVKFRQISPFAEQGTPLHFRMGFPKMERGGGEAFLYYLARLTASFNTAS